MYQVFPKEKNNEEIQVFQELGSNVGFQSVSGTQILNAEPPVGC